MRWIRKHKVITAGLSLLIILSACSGMQTRTSGKSSLDKRVLMPVIEGGWWQVAGNPDLGELTGEKQQPVDFGIWQAAEPSPSCA